jgi:hypothetical protein
MAGWVWLVVRGFKTSAGWGIAMLLVAPIAAIVAAVKDWHSWKKPFLLYWGSAGAQVVLLIVCTVALPMAFLASGGQAELAKAMEEAQRQAQNESAAADLSESHGEPAADETASDPAVLNEAPAGTVAQTGAPVAPAGSHALLDPTGRPASASVNDRASRPLTVKPAVDDATAVPPGYELVPVSAAASRAGSRVRLIDLDGRIHTGVLTGVESGVLQLSFDLGGGSVVTGFEPKEIKALQVAQAQ